MSNALDLVSQRFGKLYVIDRAIKSTNTTGVTGVRRHSNGKAFVAFHGKVYLGYFLSIKKAAARRRAYEKQVP